MMARLMRAVARFDFTLLAEALGAASLFVMLFGGLLIGHGMGLK